MFKTILHGKVVLARTTSRLGNLMTKFEKNAIRAKRHYRTREILKAQLERYPGSYTREHEFSRRKKMFICMELSLTYR
jgi:hypothetical protein